MAWSKNMDPEKLREYYREYRKRKAQEKIALEGEKQYTKECPICHKVFTTTVFNKKYCCEACKEESIRARGALRRQSSDYQAKLKAYRKTDKFKELQKQYRQTEQYKEYRKEYAKTDKYKEIMKRYHQSEKGKATSQRYVEKRKANGWKPLGEEKED